MAPPKPNPTLLDLWYRALESTEGWYVATPAPQRMIAALYSARSKANDPRLNALSLQASRRNPTGEVWIVKNLGGTRT